LFIFLLLLVIESVRLEAPIFISDSLKKTREDRIQKYNSISSVIKENGCRSYIGLYWESYVLFPFLQDRIPVSASDAIRNPVLFGEALVARPLCLAKGGNLEYLRGKIDVSSCSQRQDLIICR
ncbi:MAG: hypothetical protein K8R21_09320, partial [Leptospira sp.]|nr:hypothetical protein [Leptospira sp.]